MLGLSIRAYYLLLQVSYILIFHEEYATFNGYIVFLSPGCGGGIYEVIYMCRQGFKNGGLRERPLTEHGGGIVMPKAPLTVKTDFGI